jgi:transcriptional regulator with XRE-family HTH domain
VARERRRRRPWRPELTSSSCAGRPPCGGTFVPSGGAGRADLRSSVELRSTVRHPVGVARRRGAGGASGRRGERVRPRRGAAPRIAQPLPAERRNLISEVQRSGIVTRSVDVEGFGEGVRLRRLRGGMTQEELADRAGVSVRGLRKLEAGETGQPRPRTVRALGVALGVGPAEWDAFRAGAHPGSPGRAPFRWPPPRQLPAESPRSVLGERELAALDGALLGGSPFGVPVAVVTGPTDRATALMLRWAHRVAPRYPDAQLFGRLRGPAGGRRPAGPVLRGFLRALGVPAGEVPGPLDDAAALYRSLLCDRRALVVLEGASDAAQVRPLLPGTPGAVVLVTGSAGPAALADELGAAVVVPVAGPVRCPAELGG